MARPLRIEFPGAVYHVTSRGDRKEEIFRIADDRRVFLDILGQAMERFDAQVLAYCLMGNHYHLVLHTRQANLSRLMRHLNGVYTQYFNRRHDLVGHLFQGRFKAILVDRDAYLLSLCRYVERNPVAAKKVRSAGDWEWSSYRAHVGDAQPPVWLDTDGLHGYLLERAPESARDRVAAGRKYALLVEKFAEQDAGLWKDGLRQQIFLGSERFVDRMRGMLSTPPAGSGTRREVPRAQRARPRQLRAWIDEAGSREEGLRRAYRDGGMTMTAIAHELGLSVSRVSRLIAAAERNDATTDV
ncbi:MAG: transposase [Betaproteobacteria bacterium]|nr:transposase [Betaproteobacteria bacterium]